MARQAPDLYDLEQDAFTRALDPGRNQTQPVADPNLAAGSLASGIGNRAATGAFPTDAPSATSSEGNGVNAREALGGYAGIGNMRGFNTDRAYGGDLKAANSVKNTFGRIASRYGNDAAGRDALLKDADFMRYFPNAKLVGDDKIDFGGILSDFESGTPVNVVDVLQGFDNGGAEGWQWLDQNFAGDAAPSGGGTVQPNSDLMAAILADGGLTGNDTLAQIQRELQALIQGQPSDLAQESFLREMR